MEVEKKITEIKKAIIVIKKNLAECFIKNLLFLPFLSAILDCGGKKAKGVEIPKQIIIKINRILEKKLLG